MAAVDARREARGDLDVIDTEAELAAGIDRLQSGHGPVAIDTERASGFRYSDRAYLVQIFRRGTGTLLIDPIPFGSLANVAEVIQGEQWILHAATQDLPCMREIDLNPTNLFDTELASRLLGKDRVGLGAVVEDQLGIELAKAHSADDWSTRPLPTSWLAYAALDVELLVDVRDRIAEELVDAGKDEWARQEFEYLLNFRPKPQDPERWRRLARGTTLRQPRQLAVARELWFARDEYASETDTAPGRIVPDRALTAAAAALPRTRGQLAALKEFNGRESRSQLDRWWAAVERGLETTDLPKRTTRTGNGIPHPKSWEHKRPEAAERFKAARPAVAARAEELHVPTDNLLTPAFLRQVCWEPSGESAESISRQLARLGAREWQINITAPIIADAFVDAQ
ncbi:HRDC domain-containing protein [Gulosibacter molinativorax]|uniref:Ribonuclease D n=1 Tax=Gulosibacter molinativorax TaxID=256821 RepID=A0ABT7C5I2_9MICO|nr:HRDC domain-containing protein [Gulosibacter molinativorax]MDJ1370462.1 ribonuclease D [Gulosibacter molinativorax]QUY61376.1 Ribonuclease D [Gulosibacter molinativorax]